VFSNNWKLREEGLRWLEREYRQPNELLDVDPGALFTALMGVCRYTLADKVAAVFRKALTR